MAWFASSAYCMGRAICLRYLPTSIMFDSRAKPDASIPERRKTVTPI
jgi:hypothetical protein